MDIVLDVGEEVTIHYSKLRDEPGTTITVTQGMAGLGIVEIKGETQTFRHKITKGNIE